jgi:GT2 family glycosyltransferase
MSLETEPCPKTVLDDALLVLEASILIVSFNTREVLRECLQAARTECHGLLERGLEAEILVVDNGSVDGSIEMLQTDFPDVRLIRSAINLGFGAANNVAIEQARGRYLVLINSDAFFLPGMLLRAIQHMDEMPACGVGGAKLLYRSGKWQPSSHTFHSLGVDFAVLTGLSDQFPKSKLLGRIHRTFTDLEQPGKVDWITGAFLIVRPSVLREVGLFDPSFFLYYEEVDLCLRIQKAGYEVWFWPDVVITHIGGESSRQIKTLEFSARAAQVVLWRMRSTLLYYRKHHGWKALPAKWMEQTLYRITVVRNALSFQAARKDRGRHHKVMIALMDQAWKETQGGRISPPRPW